LLVEPFPLVPPMCMVWSFFCGLPKKSQIVEKPMDKIVKRVVKSPSAPRLQMAWRTDSYGTKEARIAELVAQILSTNSNDAGLLDLNLNQKQKVLRSMAYVLPFKQYGYLARHIYKYNHFHLLETQQLRTNSRECCYQ